ncbi:MAG: low-specificity L-threonine aldolase [Verrucomicrobiota bacterium]
MSHPIDLRSDTVARPGTTMRQAMAEAEVGDDVFNDDPTTQKLEALAARTLGKEAALFAPSGTQTNLIALLTHCARGDEYIVGQSAHTYLYEGGGGAALGGIQPQPLTIEPDGTLNLDKVEGLIKPDDFHYARTRLLCLENTSHGRVLPLSYLQSARDFVDKHNLNLHLDGARLFNAAVASGDSPAAIAAPFDSISFCLSKGLGAPVGSLLVGSTNFINQARRWRKVVGGGLRQSGQLAAAGIYALENHVDRLADDHTLAQTLADGLATIPNVTIDYTATNMVFARFPDPDALAAHLAENNILIFPGTPTRLVTHLDLDQDAIAKCVDSVAAYAKQMGR